VYVAWRMVKRRAGQRKRKLRDLIEYSVLVGFCAVFLLTALYFVINPTPIPGPEQTHIKATIVDQLSITQPNQTFIERATEVLEEAGFSVDVYNWTSVTVDFYRDLPSMGYKLIVFRTHSGILMNATGQPVPGNPVFLFTAEQYDPNRHTWLLLTDQVAPANPWDIQKFYFAISPKFVRESMNGRFQDTLIIIAGCHGLYSTTMAEALIERGASIVISWDKGILAPYMDGATGFLLDKLLIENKTIKQAVKETMETIGPDPDEGAVLQYYPIERGDKTAWNLTTYATAPFLEVESSDHPESRRAGRSRPHSRSQEKITPLPPRIHNNTRLIPSGICRDASCPC